MEAITNIFALIRGYLGIGDGFAGRPSVDVLFLMDCTGSMSPWLQIAKRECASIAEVIRAKESHAVLRMGFVGYRDYNESVRFDEIPFSTDIEDVQRRLQPIEAPTGGGDPPEDVAGGLQKAINAGWAADTRIIIMVADAPAHGRKYYADPDMADDYPDGDPDRLDPEAQIKELARNGVDFYFINCDTKGRTDRMVQIFKEAFEGAKIKDTQVFSECKLASPDQFHRWANNTLAGAPTRTAEASSSLDAPPAPVDSSGRAAEDVASRGASLVGTAAPLSSSVGAGAADGGSSFRAAASDSMSCRSQA